LLPPESFGWAPSFAGATKRGAAEACLRRGDEML
jgi:hypothetical protein